MGKGYVLLLFVALALIVAMALTVLWGRDSKHGYGALPGAQQIHCAGEFTLGTREEAGFT